MYIEVEKVREVKDVNPEEHLFVLGLSDAGVGLVSFKLREEEPDQSLNSKLLIVFRTQEMELFNTYSFLNDGKWLYISPSAAELKELNHIATRILRYIKDDKGQIYKHTLTYLLLKLKWLYTIGNLRVKPNGTRSQKVLELIRAMKNNLSDKRTIAYYANVINVSQSYLGELCQNELNVSFKSLSNQLTVIRILDLFYHSTFSFGEIANTLHFADQAHFNRFFKKHLEVTPSEFRTAVVI